MRSAHGHQRCRICNLEPRRSKWLAPSRARCQPPVADFAHCSDRWEGFRGDAAQQNPAAVPADAQERSRLLELQRTAGAQLQQARRDGATADQIKKALLDASSSLAALGEANLDPALREELKRAASELATLASGDLQNVTPATAPVLALLEKVKTSLEADVALGLSFQGSYSQTKPKERAYGGHASAMGPAPPNVCLTTAPLCR